MFGLPDFLMDPKMLAWREEQTKRMIERRIPLCVDWRTVTKFVPQLNLRHETFVPPVLFDVAPMDGNDVNKARKENLALSPKGEWAYCVKRLKRGSRLALTVGGKSGDVLFDGPVCIPAVHTRKRWDKDTWDESPYMSITPMEIMTLRPGTRRAKGHVVIAGLGLGHQLEEVSKRKQVRRITLVEKSQDLMDWLWPKIEPRLDPRFRGSKSLEIIVGNAYDVLPRLEADVALIDIFPDYGGNEFSAKTPGIYVTWCWGSPSVRETGGW